MGGCWSELVATVTKRDLVEHVATRSKLPRSSVKLAIETLLEEMVSQLESGNRIEIRDFGVLSSKLSAARVAKNPKTMEPVEVPPRATVRFKPGSLMRERVQKAAEAGGGAWAQPDGQQVVVRRASMSAQAGLNGTLP